MADRSTTASGTSSGRITLTGAISMGTGVMIGAGVFALTGQVAAAAGPLFPVAFGIAAVVAGTTAYSYVKLSNTFPSAGGIGRFLTEAYGVGPIAAVFTMAMWASMVLNESLVARTFGTYFSGLVGIEPATVWVAGLGVVLLVGSFAVNAAGNRAVNATESIMAVVKIGGLVLFAGACLVVADFPSGDGGGIESPAAVSLVGAVAIALLAFKGFTTITNTGAEIEDPHRNVGRAIVWSIAIVTVIYLAVAFAVRGNLTLTEIIAARDDSLAEAARPVFGSVGFRLVAGLAVVATVTSVMASMYSTSRMLGMMSDMGEVPEVTAGRRLPFGNPPLVVTTAAAIVLTVLFDLTRIAALGAFAYLTLDLVIHWGHWRHLRPDTGARGSLLLAAVGLDAVVLAGLVGFQIMNDPLVVGAFVVFAVLVGGGETVYMRRYSDATETG
ncbi:APC family permease [Rhabdothermincola salaria]|uniref:APC family permease n=1 Tax=Rhabdothermincola salaria TaxID=2903142 RepID=UPI001E42F73B|nr:APC family permease [Rhabdothermincola salaria]